MSREPGAAPQRARKRFGQHFLTDPRILARIVDALAPTAADVVVEVGPGRGALTELLAARAGCVVAVEIDRDLAAALRTRYDGSEHVRIVEGDVLDADLARLGGPDYLLVGNLPYYITTPVIFRALASPRPRRAVFLVQREVAERLAAPAGTSAYGALSVNVRALARVDLVFGVRAGAFQPRPSVESALVRLVPLDAPLVSPHEEAPFRSFVRAAFGMRRKQLQRVLRGVANLSAERAAAVLAATDIPPATRPESLGPEEFVRVYRASC